MKEPKRLIDSAELPPSLRDALRTLERQAPSPETIARVQSALEGLPTSVAPAAAVGGGGTSVIMVVAVAALAVAAALGMRSRQHSVEPAATSPRSTPPDSLPEPTSELAPTPAAQASIREPAQPKAAVVGLADERSRRPSRTTRPQTKHRAAAQRPALQALGQNAPVGLAASEPLDTGDSPGSTRDTASEEAVQAVQPHAGAAAAQPAAPKPPPLAPEDEAGVLYRAKRLAVQNPQAALRLLESHARFFPKGSLVQEREVLAIRLYQLLGNAAKAQWLAAQFRERFPNSVYRSALP